MTGLGVRALYRNYEVKNHLQPESWSGGDSSRSGSSFCRLQQDLDLPCRSASSKNSSHYIFPFIVVFQPWEEGSFLIGLSVIPDSNSSDPCRSVH